MVRQSLNFDQGGFLSSRVSARNDKCASFFHDAQLHATASRMHPQCFLVSRDKINRAFAVLFNGELHLSHRFPAFSNIRFAFLSGFYNKGGPGILARKASRVA